VLGLVDARHAEYGPGPTSAVITPVACAVPGRGVGSPALSGALKVKIAQDSRIAAIYGRTEAEEEFFCNYELNPDFVGAFAAGSLVFSGRDEHGDVRVAELVDHRFYLATLFLPQLASTPTAPHPVIVAFVRAVTAFAASRPRPT
jgi:CTP synthase (UTP-ammonia lyase)